MSVTAIVVNFNAGAALQRCVQSLLDSSLRPRVLVVDNASLDDSARNLPALYGAAAGVETLFNPRNHGYAPALNAAARGVEADYLLVVNPDCELDPRALEHLHAALEADAEAAVAGPAVSDRRGRPEAASLRRFPTPRAALLTFSGLWRLGRWLPGLAGVPVHPRRRPRAVTRVDAVSGACMLIRRRALEQVGGLDEAYRLHCEDLDLMYRLQQAGWHCLYVPAAQAMHLKGVSSRSRPLWVHRQKHLGMQRFFRKFQARECAPPLRWLVYAGIWAHYLLLLPVVFLRR